MRVIRKYFQKYWKYKLQQTKEELNTMKIGNDIYYVGVNDHQVDLIKELFSPLYKPIPT